MRSIATAVQALQASLTLDRAVTLLHMPALSLRYTSNPVAHTWEGDSYTPAAFEVRDLSQNARGDLPQATVRIASLDGTQQARFWSDSWRGIRVGITVILEDGIDSTGNVAYPTEYWRVAGDPTSRNAVTLVLANSDVQRQGLPMVATHEHACQHVYGPDAVRLGVESPCPYRGSLRSCSRTYDGENGCKAHFPDLDASGFPWGPTSSGTRIVQAKPFGGELGGLEDRLVS